MKKTTILILILVLILVVIGVAFLMLSRKTPQSPAQQNVQFPTSGTSTTTTTSQKNFLTSPEVHPDPNNAGYYFVGYQPSDTSAPYLIRYIAETHNFTISLTQEPIGVNRRKAELYLGQLLGTTEEQMCSLDYAVYVSNEVNGQYSGENLGFSFCPGAVQLPE